jgi:signal recognition particle subunit SRP54
MHRQMADMMKAMGKGKGIFGKLGDMMGMGGGMGMPQMDPAALEKLARSGGGLPGGLPGGMSGGLPGLPGLGGGKLPGFGGLPGLPGFPGKKK